MILKSPLRLKIIDFIGCWYANHGTMRRFTLDDMHYTQIAELVSVAMQEDIDETGDVDYDCLCEIGFGDLVQQVFNQTITPSEFGPKALGRISVWYREYVEIVIDEELF